VLDNGNVNATSWGLSDATATATYSTGSWITVGGKLDADGSAAAFGGNKGTTTVSSLNLQDQSQSFAYQAINNSSYFDGFIYEILLSNGFEADQNSSDYHTDRLG